LNFSVLRTSTDSWFIIVVRVRVRVRVPRVEPSYTFGDGHGEGVVEIDRYCSRSVAVLVKVSFKKCWVGAVASAHVVRT